MTNTILEKLSDIIYANSELADYDSKVLAEAIFTSSVFGTSYWPMGSGSVVILNGIDEDNGYLILKAVPDELIKDVGETMDFETFSQIDGPSCTIQFPTLKSIDQMITTLGQIKDKLEANRPKPTAYLHRHPEHPDEIDLKPGTAFDRANGWETIPLYTEEGLKKPVRSFGETFNGYDLLKRTFGND